MYKSILQYDAESRPFCFRHLQNGLKFSYQEFNQYAFGDDVELLENFEEYSLNHSNEQYFAKFELSVDSFKDKKIKKYLKEAILDCIAHHQDLLNICKEFDKRINMFLLGKVADVNFLLTAALFAIVSKKFKG